MKNSLKKPPPLSGDFLLYSGENNIPALVEMIALEKLNKDCADIDNATPMHFAVRHNNVAAVCLLLHYQHPFLKKEIRNGRTPLELAFKLKQGEIAALLYHHYNKTSSTLNTDEEIAFSSFKQSTGEYNDFNSTLEFLHKNGLEKYAKFKSIALTPLPKQKSLYERALSLWRSEESYDDQNHHPLIKKKND
jgi:hypothetical protein